MDTTVSLIDFILSYQVGLTILGAGFLTEGIKKGMGPRARRPWGERFLHAFPVLLCAAIGLSPRWLPGELPERALGGALLGTVATWLYGAIKRRVDEALASASTPS